MTDRERLLEILNVPIYPHEQVDPLEAVADYLLDNGVTFTPAVPGPSESDPNIMELCFHNGERHMKEKIIFLLDDFDKDYTLGDPFIEYDAIRKALMDL